jgi:hypothetical protein
MTDSALLEALSSDFGDIRKSDKSDFNSGKVDIDIPE